MTSARLESVFYLFTIATFVCIIQLLSIYNLSIDPFIRHDDYPVLLGYHEIYYQKTLQEGRWLNYFWSLRPFVFDHRVFYYSLHAFWALTSTLMAAAIIPDEKLPWRRFVVALAFSFCPAIMNISLWPGTLAPGFALVAAYGFVIAFGSMSARFKTLPLFVVLTLMSHGSFPLMLAVMALVAPGWRSGQAGLFQMTRFAFLFAASFAVGVVAISLLNYAAHDYFGVEVGEWRDPRPARDLAGAAMMVKAHLGNVSHALVTFFHQPLLSALLIVSASFLMLSALNRDDAMRVLFAFALIFSVLAAQTLVVGVLTPFRGLFPFWTILVSVVALSLRNSTKPVISLFCITLLLFQVERGAYHWRLFLERFPDFQSHTRAIAQEIDSQDPGGEAKVIIWGDARGIPGGAVIYSSFGLIFRLKVFSDRKITMCVLSPEACERYKGFAEGPVYPAEGSITSLPDGAVFLRLPEEPLETLEEGWEFEG